jgi:hypothetical protein
MGGILTNNVSWLGTHRLDGLGERAPADQKTKTYQRQGLSSWEKVHDKAVQRMHKVLTQSVFPACERLLLRLEDLISWGMECVFAPRIANARRMFTESRAAPTHSKATFGLNLPEDQLEKCIAWVRYLAMRTLELDREMNEESKRFHEFAKWAKYGAQAGRVGGTILPANPI